MGDRHGGCFARRGRTLSLHRCGFPMPRRGGRDLPRAGTRPSAKASRHGARAKGFAPRRNTPLGEGLPTRRTSERICPAQKRSPRRRPPDTAHERKGLPRARTLPTAKTSRHGTRAKGFAPRENAPLGEGLSTRRTGERICPAQERSPRRRPPDTAHEQKNLPRAGTLPTAKASRHGARAKGFAPRRNAPHGEGLPTRRTSERICPRARTLPSAKPSRHGARAKGFAPRGSRSPHVPTNGGPPSTDEQPEKHPFGGVAPETARPLPSSFTEKK